jgi:GT2 family glycosyltransferase
VVDNASEDGSMASLPEHVAIEIILLDENTGFAAANNLALTHLQDIDLVMTLNPDAFVQPGCLLALLDAAVKHVEYNSFACRMMSNVSTLDGAGDSYHITGLVWRNLHGRPMTKHALVEREVFSPCAGAALYRRRALDEVGGFDESFFCYVEDADLGYRLLLADKRCIYIPDAVVEHIGSAISDRYPGFAVYHGHRNLVWAFVKNTPLPILLLVLPLHIIMTILLLFFFVRNGQWRVYLRAKKDALVGVPRVWKQRDQVMSSRRISLWQLLKSYNYRIVRK